MGLRKLEEFGLYNVIFEIDLGDSVCDFKKFPLSKYLQNIKRLIEWAHEKLHKDAKVLINFRDLMDAMPAYPERVFETANFLTTLPEEIRLFGLIFEDSSGKSVPEAIGSSARFIRRVMNDNKFKGHFLVHIHEKFGYKDASTTEVK